MKAGSSSQKLTAIAIFAAAAICALTPAIASARQTVPPGATEGDQYVEQAPNGGGSSSPNRYGGGGSGGSQAVPATQALNALGPEGQAAADLANFNQPPQKGTNRAPQQGKSGNPNPNPNPKSNPQPSSSTQGEGGMGLLLPLLLVVTALAAVGYGLRRRLNPA